MLHTFRKLLSRRTTRCAPRATLEIQQALTAGEKGTTAMITWTVTTHPENNPEILTASGAEPNLADAKRAAADAVRYALLDATDHVSPDNGSAPSYLVTLDDTCALIVGLGRCRPANYNGVLDSLERFDGSAPPHLLYM